MMLYNIDVLSTDTGFRFCSPSNTSALVNYDFWHFFHCLVMLSFGSPLIVSTVSHAKTLQF